MLPNWLYGKSLKKLQEILNSGGQAAENVSYSNTESGLEATNAQDAIDELTSEITDLNAYTDISSAFSFNNDVTGKFLAIKQGNIVCVTFDINLPSSYTTDAALNFGEMSNYNPAEYVHFTAMRGISSITGTACRGDMSTNGRLNIYCPSASSGAVRGSFTYVTV